MFQPFQRDRRCLPKIVVWWAISALKIGLLLENQFQLQGVDGSKEEPTRTRRSACWAGPRRCQAPTPLPPGLFCGKQATTKISVLHSLSVLRGRLSKVYMLEVNHTYHAAVGIPLTLNKPGSLATVYYLRNTSSSCRAAPSCHMRVQPCTSVAISDVLHMLQIYGVEGRMRLHYSR